jgi:hypothetical protein
MGQSPRTMQSTDDRSVVLNRLIEQQKQTKEGSAAWYSCQQEINQVIAERYLQMLNS